MRGGLLNPPQEAPVCRSMIDAVRQARDELERQLSSQLMEREAYLQTFGAVQALKRVQGQIETIYKGNFEV